MKTVVVLVGVRGSGKSTALERCKSIHDIVRLQPTTSRPPREDDGDQYNYLDSDTWNKSRGDFAWTITVGQDLYGMRLSQLQVLPPGCIGLTVFHPGNIASLDEFKKLITYEIITVGLDTIASYEELQRRIAADPSRDEGKAAFESQTLIVRNCDVVLKGDADTIAKALSAIMQVLGKRGVLDHDVINNLLDAGTLLNGTLSDNTKSASYDLRLGDNSWCKGRLQKLSPDSPLLIPPYSYVIVEAEEKAQLPRFIAARYDLTVSLFLDGIILSNGPQVDPGYNGGLLCMLFNGSDSPVGIRHGDHFATIEFFATSTVTPGYKDHHQYKKALAQFMSRNAIVGSGGTLVDKFEALARSWDNFRNVFIWGTIIAVAAIVLTLIPWAYDVSKKAEDASMKVDDLVKADSRLLEEDELKRDIEAELQKLKSEEQNAMLRMPASDSKATSPTPKKRNP